MKFIELSVPTDIMFHQNNIYPFIFKEIDDTYDEFSIGWVDPLNMFSTVNPFLELGDYVILKFRVDQRKVSTAVLKRMVAKEELRVRTERQIPKLSRVLRAEIKERIRTELLRKSIPVSTSVDIIWDVAAGRILFCGSNPELLEDLFNQSFGVVPQRIEYEHTDDFLTWCWWKSVVIEINGRMTIGDGPEQQVVCAEGPEAVKALMLGKKIRKAGIRVGEYGTCTLAPGLMEFNSVKISQVTVDTGVGAMLDKCGLFFAMVDAVIFEYETYFNRRLVEQTPLIQWIMGGCYA
jgi:hypothetical protein